MNETAIECRGLSLRDKKKSILHDVTCTVPAGSLTGLLGPNGAGKSSLFRLISGLVKPDAGTVTIFGEPAGPDRLIQMAMLPDRASLPHWLTAGEWLGLASKLYSDWDAASAELLQEQLG